MAKIITIAGQKGGVGKTSTALNLGYSLSRKGKKVLMVDGDPQGGLTAACNLKKKTAKGLLHIMEGAALGSDAIHPLYHNLSALGAGVVQAEDIAAFESAAAGEQLTSILRNLTPGFDYLIVDAPVGIGAVVRSLLSASDYYLLVINCKAATMKTLPRLMKTGEWVSRNVNPDLSFLSILVNMYDSGDPSEKKIYSYFKSTLSQKFFFDTVIPTDTRLEAASFRSIPVARLKDGGETASSFDRLADEILLRTGELPGEIQNDENARITDEENDFYTSLLKQLCERSDYHAAVVADEMGFPLAAYNCPIDTDALAAFTSVLGDSLEKSESILEQEDPNNITLEINETDKVALHRFSALNSTYYLLVICPRAAAFPGNVESAASEITARLTE